LAAIGSWRAAIKAFTFHLSPSSTPLPLRFCVDLLFSLLGHLYLFAAIIDFHQSPITSHAKHMPLLPAPFAEQGKAVTVMRAIKQALDPDNNMNPEKVLVIGD
jgi:hypothetical protein